MINTKAAKGRLAMTKWALRLSCGLAALILLAGCAGTGTTVLLLPDPDGKVGKVSLASQQGARELSKAGQAASVATSQAAPGEPFTMDPSQIRQLFGRALNAQPEQPALFILYFMSGGVGLTPQSQQAIPLILAEVKRRASRDISVVGHADTAGSTEYNIKLSLRRAHLVRDLLTKDGVAPADIVVASYGERDLLVKTADNVAEPRNRRVEVVVR